MIKIKSLLVCTLICYPFSVTQASTITNKMPCPNLCAAAPKICNEECPHGIHITVGLLYEQPYIPKMVAGIEFAQTEDIEGDVDYASDLTNHLEECFDYAIGLTTSLGMVLDHDDWFLEGRFDYISATTRHNYDVNDDPVKELYPYEQYLGTEGTGDHAQALFAIADHGPFREIEFVGKINSFLFDVTLSRGSYHSKWFSYTPFAGVKSIWFSTMQLPKYVDTQTLAQEGTDQNNWGVGPLFGFIAEFSFFKNISIFSDSDIALLLGNSHKTITAFYQSYDPSLDSQDTSTVYQNLDCIIYVPFRSTLGLKFASYFVEGRHYVALNLGFDVRVVIAINEMDRGYTMNGLYASLAWDF